MNKDIEIINSITKEVVKSYRAIGGINRIDREDLPLPHHIVSSLETLFSVLFPGYFGLDQPHRNHLEFFVSSRLQGAYSQLIMEVEKGLKSQCHKDDCGEKDCLSFAKNAVNHLFKQLPAIREMLKQDVQAAYDGDPAAKSFDEVILCYPFIPAITTYRIANVLYRRDVPLIPRIMTEWAHSKTGIDIHPGAEIGEYFFIDHGNGVVIGETSKIGNRVKIYQGVTLGALSFPKDETGKIKKGGKRHPTIEDDVTIYSNATILGGDTIIGKGAVIGANSWITYSIPAYSKVTIQVNHETQENQRLIKQKIV